MAGSSAAPRLQLIWPGKEEFLLSPKDETGKPIWVPRSHPAASEVRLVDWTGSCGDVGTESNRIADNLLFTGDSIDVLRVLAEHPEFWRTYRGKFKAVYLDPPFNTGQMFEHYDDWMEHSTWLSFMRDRLLLIRELVAPDGSVWINLDDTEQHRMRCLMDEVFGAQNYLTTVYWLRKDTRANDAKFFSPNTDAIHVYAKDLSRLALNRAPRPDAMNEAYKNPDGDRRGVWRPGPLYAKSGSKTYVYTFANGFAWSPPPGTFPRYSLDRLAEMEADGRIYFGKSGNSAQPLQKQFLAERAEGVVPTNNWHYDEVGSNRHSRLEQKALFPGIAPFVTAKPEKLIQRILHLSTKPGDLVLDVFAGSGTTAAVAHKMGRRWVTAEILPATVSTFTQPRMAKVVAGADRGGISRDTGWAGGGGFRCAKVVPSMYDVADNGTVLLSARATNGAFAEAMAAQRDFDFQADGSPFCGRRGRMRLAVLDGAVGPEDVRALVSELSLDERVTVVAKVVLPGAEEMLGLLSRGSRIRKAPRDVLADGSRRARRRERSAP